MDQMISEMTEQTSANITEAGTADFIGGYTTTGGVANRKFSLANIGNWILNKFKMNLGGSSQTVKSAIDSLNSKAIFHEYRFEFNANTGLTLSILGNSTRYIGFTASTLDTLTEMFCLFVSATGAIFVSSLIERKLVYEVDNDNRTVKISHPTQGNSISVALFKVYGNGSVAIVSD